MIKLFTFFVNVTYDFFAGFPTTLENGSVDLVHTAPAPTIENFPIFIPHIIVELAPKVAPS